MTVEELKALFHYDPDTGVFTRKVTTAANARAGMVAGCRNKAGYLVIRVGGNKGKLHYAHRLAWLFVHGELPPDGMDLDHLNGDKADNRIANLRLATRGQNNQNTKPRSRHGHKGIKWNVREKTWAAWISIDGNYKHIGTYATKERAIDARVQAEIIHYREFRRAA